MHPNLHYSKRTRLTALLREARELLGTLPAFDGSTPLQIVERGETDRIWRILYDLESGQPG